MKSIIISINPEWVEEILNGEKTIEIRKTAPKCDLPIDVYIYCTKGGILVDWGDGDEDIGRYGSFTEYPPLDRPQLQGKVVAKFTLRRVENVLRMEGPCPCDALKFDYRTKTLVPTEFYDKSCLSPAEVISYGNGRKVYAWHISDLEIFDEPKKLGEFMPVCSKKKCNGCKYFGGQHEWDIVCNHPRPLSKAPQSWCYVEVEE